MRESESDPEPERELAPEELEVRDLLRAAGPRPVAPAEDLEEIKRMARLAWKEREPGRQPRRRRPRRALLLAASLVLAALVGWLWIGRGGTRAPVRVRCELMRGDVWFSPASGGERSLAVGEVLLGPGILRTAARPVALRMAGGRSIRLASDSRLRIEAPGKLRLESGAVYVDSVPAAAARPALSITTPFGVVEELGTQYQLRLDEERRLTVGVREGVVSLENGDERFVVGAGEALVLLPDGSAERRVIEPGDSAWSWAVGVAPAPEIEGRRLTEVVAWAERETGWEVRWADATLAAAAAEIELHGSVAGLTPAEALEVVLSGSGLESRRDGGVVEIYRP